jgi:hypothetical protein
MAVPIEKMDFCFENLLVRVVADRNYPEIELAGLSAVLSRKETSTKFTTG